MLKRLTVRGFKSFKQELELLIEPGLTVVVGPNGSGKSNLAEAIRWVLGEQSAKKMRARAGRDVLHAGGGGQRGVSAAEVSLVFDNSSGLFDVPESEVEIARLLTKSGESAYVLNGQAVALGALQQHLSAARIGTRSYTVINQGMVDRYLLATPLQRRELFDEATGVRGLQLKIEQAKRKHERIVQRLQELTIRKQEMEPRVRLLKREVDRGERKAALEGEHALLLQAWVRSAWRQRMREEAAAREAGAAIERELVAARAARAELEEQLLKRLGPGGQSETAHELTELQVALKEAELTYAQADERYRRWVDERGALQKQVAEAQQKRKAATTTLAAVKEQVLGQLQLGSMTAPLQECEQQLAQVLEQETIDRGALEQIQRALRGMLADASAGDGEADFGELWSALEEPLQELARWRTLADERERRLAALAPQQQPTRAAIDELKRDIAAAEVALAETGVGEWRAELEAARDAEVAAERAAERSAVQCSDAERALQETEALARRELGEAWLAAVQREEMGGVVSFALEQEWERLQELAARAAALGEADPLVAQEYAEVNAQYEDLAEQVAGGEVASVALAETITKLDGQLSRQFKEQLKKLEQVYSSYAAQLFSGARVRLSILDDRGIEIDVRLPGKRARHLDLLSGGEKALLSLALLLAIVELQQPPFLVLDEVDAALDEINSERFAQLIAQHSRQTQMLVITHNRETMAQADVLYGVSMGKDGASRVYGVRMADVVGENQGAAEAQAEAG